MKKTKYTLPLLITRNLVAFPNISENIDIGRDFSIASFNEAYQSPEKLIFITSQNDIQKEKPSFDEIFEVGVICKIISATFLKEGVRARIMPLNVAFLSEFNEQNGVLMVTGAIKYPIFGDSAEEISLYKSIFQEMDKAPELITKSSKSLQELLTENSFDCYEFGNIIATSIKFPTVIKQQILEELDANKRLMLILTFLQRETEAVQIEAKINTELIKNAEKNQKEYILREKLRIIKKELGDEQSGDDIYSEVEKQPYPEYIKKKIKSELSKMDLMPSGSQENALIRNYVDFLIKLPWWQKTEDNNDLKLVKEMLDEDHYGLNEVKQRIIEYLAVKTNTNSLKAPILCFYGPPGVGKTSLAKSIARVLNRKFIKCSLGGVYDESEIRGHRRTYVGALPGRIINGLYRNGVVNPVILLDEIDKLGGQSMKGDPSSALLEVLDPEQNNSFNDNYLDEPYDLSNVLFIATANYLQNVPAPLRDRIELIELSSYTDIEKIEIARRYLIKRIASRSGLNPDNFNFTDEALLTIINGYTKEAGVRELERKLEAVFRKMLVEIVLDGKSKRKRTIDKKDIIKYLGTVIFETTMKEKKGEVGLVTGLAYTQYGGEILPIEINSFLGKGGLVLTGNLGDVMKESCSIALDYVKANAEKYKIPKELFLTRDMHIHVPDGSVPKDGPSAGIAITTAIISCLTNQKISNEIAMTGEVTLRGRAIPIGGLREKSLAAIRSGIKTVIVPKANKSNVEDLPKEIKDQLTFIYMTKVDDALKVVFNFDD